jgi:hypothetical protein
MRTEVAKEVSMSTANDKAPRLESPAVRSLVREQVREALKSPREKKDDLDEALEETFPASDPVSPSSPTIPGHPDKA